MSGKTILLVAKRPMMARLSDDDVHRLENHPLLSADLLRNAADDHERARLAVRAALAGHQVCERVVDELRPEDAQGIDLAITVGGDGTVFAVNALGVECPLITVNSDPARSVGHFTRCRVESFPALLAAWIAGQHVRESRHETPLRRGHPALRWFPSGRFAVSYASDLVLGGAPPRSPGVRNSCTAVA